jgi:signal transduction histidine kinase
MVDKILDIEAIERKSYNLQFEEVDLREILNETINEFGPIAREKNILLESNINGKISLVKLDKQHARQVFNNLISNAIKFSPANKKIEVKLGADNDEIVTEIVDEGPGLTAEDKEKVFKKFQKLSAQPTGNEESSGLGLSIVKKYVEAMNAKVWVASTSGKGASFKVAFQKA